jgi:hypothetical protein
VSLVFGNGKEWNPDKFKIEVVQVRVNKEALKVQADGKSKK